MDTQKNLMLAFVALLTVASIYIISKHQEKMKQLDVELAQVAIEKIETPKSKGMW